MAPIKTVSGITMKFHVERIYTLRVYVAVASITGTNPSFPLDYWHDLDKRKLKRKARKGLEIIK